MSTPPWDLDAVQALVGTETVYTAPDALSHAAIRYFASAIGASNPIYTDAEYARAAGRTGVVAPPTLLAETNQYVTGRDPDDAGYVGHTWDFGITGTRLIRGGNSYEFHKDATPDTVVTATWRITDVAERAGRAGQLMLFITSEATYTDQHGDLLMVDTETIIHQQLPSTVGERP